jgi:D-gamma-glutamyl-meso-diaminopimelic acid endopeptidase CwlS/peptidoglycan endopeptidase LytE
MKKQLMAAAVTTGILFTAFGASASADQGTYTVISGDSLWKVSQTYHVTIDQLKQWNNLSSDILYVNQNLLIVPPSSQTAAATTADPATANSIYTVKSGDSLSVIAKSFNTTVDGIKTLNGLTSDIIKVGQQLKIPTSSSTVPTLTVYTVQSGDCLSLIASRFSISVTDLKAFNNLTSDTIYVGQVLKVSGSSAPAGSTSTTASAPVTASPTPVTTTSAPASAPVETTVSKAQAVIDEAKKYIGVPYVWGGSTPSGFDCSGLVNYVFNKVGVSVPRTVATLWAGEKPVSAPIPGDLVFFDINQTGTPSHVGIYLGNNQFIHAGSSGVTISDMTATYWKTRYIGARTAL